MKCIAEPDICKHKALSHVAVDRDRGRREQYFDVMGRFCPFLGSVNVDNEENTFIVHVIENKAH